ncbi:helix-turn-helix transcriptional regulator [Streptococcus parasanguinis]|jgi:transcriptional regulator|uniref:helix-turn-helix transcriptional regulator n=1 Tax=Streptococcus parasanguinis TaxID=1318 RepID=UPI0020011C51|nr:helix-turn-helix transcriptional regulator [Streptococcus parasanguinis]DAN77220.1 MAG TPA: Repressor protein CI [Caudoviricetes sp.]
MEKELKNHSTGNRIKELRKANKLTHKELAGKLGISTRTLQMWESGKNLSFIPKMSKLADFFGVSITDLFDLPGPKGMDKIKESEGLKKIKIVFSNSQETEFLVEDLTQDELTGIFSQFYDERLIVIRNFYANPNNVNYIIVDDFEEYNKEVEE